MEHNESQKGFEHNKFDDASSKKYGFEYKEFNDLNIKENYTHENELNISTKDLPKKKKPKKSGFDIQKLIKTVPIAIAGGTVITTTVIAMPKQEEVSKTDTETSLIVPTATPTTDPTTYIPIVNMGVNIVGEPVVDLYSINITLEPYDVPEGVTSYVASLSLDGAIVGTPQTINISGSSQSVAFEKLDYNTEYLFNITAETEYFEFTPQYISTLSPFKIEEDLSIPNLLNITVDDRIIPKDENQYSVTIENKEGYQMIAAPNRTEPNKYQVYKNYVPENAIIKLNKEVIPEVYGPIELIPIEETSIFIYQGGYYQNTYNLIPSNGSLAIQVEKPELLPVSEDFAVYVFDSKHEKLLVSDYLMDISNAVIKLEVPFSETDTRRVPLKAGDYIVEINVRFQSIPDYPLLDDYLEARIYSQQLHYDPPNVV